MPLLETGDKAPDFALTTDRGETFRLSEQRGKAVVLEFYCEDDSGGCVIENAEFSALVPEFEKLGVTVVGLSPQDVETHRRFSRKHDFKHPLVADPDRKAIEPYGLWAKKKLWGHEFMGVLRVTYLIDAEGKIAGVFKASRIKGHAQKVLEAARALVATRPR